MPRPNPSSVYRRRRGALAFVSIGMVAVIASIALSSRDAEPTTGPRQKSPGLSAENKAAPSTSSANPSPTTTTTPTGRFTVAPGGTEVVGRGTLIRYQVEVEDGSGADAAEFAAAVDKTLADPRGWTTVDGISLQRVSDGTASYTVRLATPSTTDVLCLPLTTDGQVSCGHNNMAVINLTRWQVGADPPRLSVANYRHYLISHEFGHLLGHGHVPCPEPGQPAPVMMQQTYSIGDCAPNPWPQPG